jgi:hypothetical protein
MKNKRKTNIFPIEMISRKIHNRKNENGKNIGEWERSAHFKSCLGAPGNGRK